MHTTVNDLDPHARDLLLTSLTWSDRFWDEPMGLLWGPGDVTHPGSSQHSGRHTVRDSAWYALGLLVRNGPGDDERAARAISAVLDYQLDEPGKVYHGTFYRYPQEPHPPADAKEWQDYDPNWREFIMTTLASILLEYEERLPARLVKKIDAAFPKAVAGALARGLRAGYTNIALMNAFMLCYAGVRQSRPEWLQAGEDMAREVYRLFKQHDTFEEYNSPTYYGPDLYALVQWRTYPISPLLNALGAEMEALLWNDIARFYHAGLRNICGPYDRSYGMNMRQYVAVVAHFIWLATGQALAPFPDLNKPFAHSGDFLFAPAIALLGARVPESARPHFMAFQGERLVERVIEDSPRRVATAWLGETVMIGGEDNSACKRPNYQFHAATIHWRISADEVGWLKLAHNEPADARAGRNRLEIEGSGELVFHIAAQGAQVQDISAAQWSLPGLDVRVQTSLSLTRVAVADGRLVACYAGPSGRRSPVVLLTQAR